MSVSDDLKFKVGLGLVVLVGTGLALWYAKKQVGAAVDGVLPDLSKLNPFSEDNYLDDWINRTFSLGRYARPQDKYQIPPEFGIKDQSTWD